MGQVKPASHDETNGQFGPMLRHALNGATPSVEGESVQADWEESSLKVPSQLRVWPRRTHPRVLCVVNFFFRVERWLRGTMALNVRTVARYCDLPDVPVTGRWRRDYHKEA